MELLYMVFIEPLVQMARAPELLAQTLWEGAGRLKKTSN
jgi:hypothetical protein